MNSKRKLQLSRLLSQIDRRGRGSKLPEIENAKPLGTAFRIGITGPVGAGKSTLINRLTREFRDSGLTVGIIAVDPSSPFTGGAVLGDRIRMTELVLDPGVFIRSLATRGIFGGLASSTEDAADLLDMFGYDRIIIETVGVGQTEVDIVEACDATIVILEPSSGDGVQAIKAGLMEIADIFFVNKMDLRGADRFFADLEMAIAMRDPEHKIRTFPIEAVGGKGIAEAQDYVEEFHTRIKADGSLYERRVGQRARRIRRLAKSILVDTMWEKLSIDDLTSVVNSDLPARDAALRLVEIIIQK